MLVELVETTTRDGVRLDGAFQEAPTTNARGLGADVFCLVHGTGGNFYGSTLFDAFSEKLRNLGCAVLRVNTRGHDGLSTANTTRGGRRLGAAYEVVDECRYDLAAWLDWLKERGYSRLGLLGHSLGAVKCLYSLAQDPQLQVGCLIAVSPPRLSYSWYCGNSQKTEFLETFAQAERLVQSGQPSALMEVALPLPLVITAAGYVDKYGPDERYDFFKFAQSVTCPTLVLFGGVEVESNMAFRGSPGALETLAAKQRSLRVSVIAGADHFYTGVRAEAVAQMERWLKTLAT